MRLVHVIAPAAALAAVVFYFFVVSRLVVDFPFADDYDAVLGPILEIQAAQGFAEKFRVVMAQHNEHRIAFAKVTQFVLFTIQGRVDFPLLVFVGNLGLIALCGAIMLGALETIPWAQSGFVVAPLLMFTPLQGYQSIWAMTALSNFWALAFAAWCLLLLVRRDKGSFPGACLLAVLATFTSGQGLFVFVAGVVVLLVQLQRRRLVLWTALFFVTALFYFYGYAPPTHHPPAEFSLRTLLFAPAMLGAAPSALLSDGVALISGNRPPMAFRIAVGGAVLLMLAMFWWKKYYHRNLYLCTLCLYLAMLCAAGAVSRSGFGLEMAVDTHYHVISICVAVALAFALLDVATIASHRNLVHGMVLAIALGVNVLSWHWYAPEWVGFSQRLGEAKGRFTGKQESTAVLWDSLQDYGTDLLWQSYLSGLLPLRDLDFSHQVLIGKPRLQRIAMAANRDTHLFAGPDWQSRVRVLATIEPQGGEFAIRPAPQDRLPLIAPGWIGLLDGKLWCALPAD